MPDAQERSAPSKTASLMISYSRKDKVFVKQLYDSLVARGFAPEDIWVDWEGIPLSADWMAEITKGIQSSNAFIFVISPDSVASDVCAKELEIAANSNKRFIPILYREPEKGSNLHPKISSHNWVFIRDEQELEKMLPALVEAINMDLDWLAQHTRLFNRAKEWESQQRNDSYLVRGKDLQDAETFISQGAAGKEPTPTPLHAEYVQAAQKFAASVRRRNRIIAAVVGIALLILSVFALVQWGIAEQETVRANDNANTAVAEQVRADNNASTAVANEKIAKENEAIASENARAANALALSSEAIIQRGSDTQLSLVLALLSIQETAEDNYVLLESKSALFSSLNSPNVLYTWDNNGVIVWEVAYDPTGTYIAIGDGNFGSKVGMVHVFDVESRELLYSLSPFTDRISGLDFSPDGTKLAIASWDGTARVIDVASSDALFTLGGHDGASINDIKFSPNGKLIATAGDDALVKIWYGDTGTIKVSLPSHTNGVSSLAFGPDSTRLVSGSYDDTAILWDVDTNSLLFKLRPDGFVTDGKSVESVAFSSDGSRLITGGYKTVVVWDAKNGTELQRLNGNQATVYDVDFAPDNLSMVTASSGIKIWDWVYGTERFNLSSHHGEVNSVAFSSDGNQVVTGSWDYTAKLWSSNLRIETLRLKQHNSPNWDAGYSPDGKWLFTVGDSSVLIHDALTGDVVNTIYGYPVAFNPLDSRQIMTVDGTNVIIWTVKQQNPAFVISEEEAGIQSAIFSSDGKQILYLDGNDVLKKWDVENAGAPSVVDGYTGARIFDTWFGPDGNYFAAQGNNSAEIWDLDNMSNGPLELVGHTDVVLTAVFSQDGKYVYTGSYDNTVRKWDAKTGELLLVMTGHTGRVLDVDVSPDGTLIASASADTTVRIWNAEDGKEIYKYEGNNEDANSVAFSPDGTKVLTASSDKSSKEFTIDYDTLLQIAQEYELRDLTTEECQRYLKRDDCTLTLFSSAPSTNESSSSPAIQPTVTPVTEQSATVTSTPIAEQSVQPTATPTAVPTATAASSSSSGSFYTEEFESNLDSWDGFMVSGTENQVNTGVDSGSLFVQLSPDADKIPRFYLVNPAFDYSSVQMELTTTNYGNNANGVSLICNYDGTNWYEFTVSNAGLYSINAYDPTATALQGYIQLAGGGSGAVKSGQATNVYRAICNGNELTLYINDTLVKTLVDTRYNLTSGKIGLGISSPQTLPVEVSFESLTVSEP